MKTENTDKLRQYFESGRDALAAQITPETMDDAARTVDVVWFTGIDVARYDWRNDEEYLRRFDPKGVDLSLLNNGAPVADNHWIMCAADQMGRVDKAWVDGTNYMGTLRFSKRTDVDGLWQDIKDKIVTKFSMGVEILDSTDLARKQGDPLVKLATKWRPFEISVAPLPADFNTTTLARQAKPPVVSEYLKRARERSIAIANV
jgi:hypothetical protein